MTVGMFMLRIVARYEIQQENRSNMKAITLSDKAKKARQDTVSVLKEFPFFPGDFNEFIFSNFHYPPSLQKKLHTGEGCSKVLY